MSALRAPQPSRRPTRAATQAGEAARQNMRMVYGLVESFGGADAIFNALRAAGFDTAQVGLLVQAEAAKEKLKNQAAPPASAKTTAKRGQPPAPSLAQQVLRQKPVFIGDIGPVYAFNPLAQDLARVASAQDPAIAEGGLRAPLEDAGVTPHYAQAYRTAVKNGWLLIMLSVDEARAFEASKVLDQHGARETFIFIPE